MDLKLKREEMVETLLKSYYAYYDITMAEEEQRPLVARCDYFERSQKYVLSKKAELWSANCEEFLYLFTVPHLTQEIYRKCETLVYEDGMKRLHIGPGHMYSYITAVIICDSCDEDAARALKKSRIHKSFHFSLHGWMDYHAAAVLADDGRILTNAAGRCVVKTLKKVLFDQKGKRRE
ncbi:MAG: hypothetical protein Q4E91_11785 [Lachnospiraceae bacterium]|nr:hypothetical protein [Lachnospiraceae bacterium]